ncbi:MAG: penicillin-binding protein 2 [Gammaproteobacteria bacterium]|nr:MAG: penicillin-binding protein 2 [Gammaproteobacteria bacterium]
MAKTVNFKDNFRELRIHKSRALYALIAIIIMAAVLMGRLFYLQVVEHTRFITLSDRNRVHLEAIAPTRGLIFDRNGALLAENQPSYSLRIVKERANDLEKTVLQLTALIDVSPEEIKDFKNRLKQRHRPFEAIPFKFRLTEKEIAQIAVNQHQLAGVEISADLIRHYPFHEQFTHSVGYVGRINEKETQRVDPTQYRATHYIGKTGIEKYYEHLMHGEVGYQKIETNAYGRVMKILERQPPVPGQDIHLYLDAELQKLADSLLGDQKGAIVAMDPNTGGVLAFVSKPGYDPNYFVTGISTKRYSALRDSEHRPLFNRALQGQYPPGSTIKPFVALAGLEQNIINWDFKIRDPGWYQLDKDERFYRDWKKRGHGTVDLEKAIIQSCDTYFYNLAHNLGIDPLHDFMTQFNFGSRTGIDLYSEPSGLMPSSAWKKRAKGVIWYPGETLNIGIGQGYMLATPLQLTAATATLANRGRSVTPKMAKFETSDSTTPPQENLITLKDQDNWQTMVDAMVKVLHSPRGTARRSGLKAKYQIAGKTGTAQVLGIKQNEEYDETKIALKHRDHALFVGFAPAENPQIAITVIVENGGGGGSTAAPIARKILDLYINTLEKKQSKQARSEAATIEANNVLANSQSLNQPSLSTRASSAPQT